MKQNVTPEAPWAEAVPEAPYPMTLDAFARWPEDQGRLELVRGRLVRTAPRTFLHLRLTARILQGFLDCQVSYPGFWAFGVTGTFALRLRGEAHPTALGPDSALVRKTQLPTADDTLPSRQFLDVVPDLVVEIANQEQTPEGLTAKAELWLAAGTRQVWLLWPHEQQVVIWSAGREPSSETLGLTETIEGRDILPGFSLPVAALFQR